jgi:hypothetical protein
MIDVLIVSDSNFNAFPKKVANNNKIT